MDMESVADLALGLPDTDETSKWNRRTWTVAGSGFAWERPFAKADLKRFGDTTPPTGPILAVAVDDLDEKEILLAQGLDGFFTITHFDGYPAVLVQLDVADDETVRNAVIDAWLCKAPAPTAQRYLDTIGRSGPTD